jgi:hypothetical protein
MLSCGPRMPAVSSKTRTWAILTSLFSLPILLYPPWQGGRHGSLFSPPGHGSLDYGRLLLELSVVVLIAMLAVAFVSLQRWLWLQAIWSRAVSRGLLVDWRPFDCPRGVLGGAPNSATVFSR